MNHHDQITRSARHSLEYFGVSRDVTMSANPELTRILASHLETTHNRKPPEIVIREINDRLAGAISPKDAVDTLEAAFPGEVSNLASLVEDIRMATNF